MVRAAVVLALLLASCGSGNAPGTSPAPPAGVSSDCADSLSGLYEAVTDLNSRLSVGLNFADYSERVADIRVAYDRVNFKELDQDCITGEGVPLENAFNEFVAAYNTWNDCTEKPDCTNDSIQTELQGHWSKATSFIDEVKGRLP